MDCCSSLCLNFEAKFGTTDMLAIVTETPPTMDCIEFVLAVSVCVKVAV